MEAMLATLVDHDPIRDEVHNRVYRGREEVAARYRELWTAFPDFTVIPTRLVEGEDTVMIEADYSGTHRGTYNGVPGTGKSFKVRIVVVFSFRGDRIASESIYMDLSSQLRQLGLK
jgi:steroid delta-isomerase-like uncharacterized protein